MVCDLLTPEESVESTPACGIARMRAMPRSLVQIDHAFADRQGGLEVGAPLRVAVLLPRCIYR